LKKREGITQMDNKNAWRWEQGGPDERAVLVGVHLPHVYDGDLGGRADIEELARLVETAGGRVIDRLEQRLKRPNSRVFLGRGKLEELKDLVTVRDANLVVFDNELSPAQGRNLEKELDVNVIDRTELILDIFARHANTRQASLQVELAQLQYFLPRLRRLWSHLERQAGGIGTRGPGETQLETDRQLIGRRITRLKKVLREIATDRRVQRRVRHDMYRAVLVGYTNAGKSTLMNGVTGASVYVRDKLFATLDATTRRVEADERRRFLLTDTVGFIRRLPHHLVESFRATLMEVVDADLLVHVVDAASGDPELQIASVNKVLGELVPSEKDTLLVFNKLDKVDRELFVNRFGRLFPDALFLSARHKEGHLALREAILDRIRRSEKVYRLRLPADRMHCLAVYHRSGAVLEQDYADGVCTATVRMTAEELRRLLAAEPSVELVEEP
jgi:GTP-binding protein HflX